MALSQLHRRLGNKFLNAYNLGMNISRCYYSSNFQGVSSSYLRSLFKCEQACYLFTYDL